MGGGFLSFGGVKPVGRKHFEQFWVMSCLNAPTLKKIWIFCSAVVRRNSVKSVKVASCSAMAGTCLVLFGEIRRSFMRPPLKKVNHGIAR